MMKHLVYLMCLLSATVLYPQASTLDKIAEKTCEYLESEEIKNLDKDQRVIKLGVFIIGQYGDHKDALATEGIVFDFSEADAGRKFGEKVGFAMVNFCPNALIALSEDVSTNDSGDGHIESFTGTIKSIKGEDFSFVQVEDTSGVVQNFLWLSNFKGSERLIAAGSAKGLKVKVHYKNTECFSPKLKEYINRKEIVEIAYLE